MEICVGAKIRVPFKGVMVTATVTDIERIELPNRELGWAVHLVADPPCERTAFGFPVRGDLSSVSIAKIEEVFEQQLNRRAKPVAERPPEK